MTVDIGPHVEMYPAGYYRSNATFHMDDLKWELLIDYLNFSEDKGDF